MDLQKCWALIATTAIKRIKKPIQSSMTSDDKPEKEITRNMMRMTMDINKKYFQFNETVTAEQVQAVTCFTCHRGEPMPIKEKKNTD